MTKYFNDFKINLNKMIYKINNNEHILQLNYAYLISCMETYLSSAMWGMLEKYPKYYNSLGKSIDKSVKLGAICDKGLSGVLKEELKKFQYHNLLRLKIHYKNAFNVKFREDLNSLLKAVGIRHDIVHRCGESKDNIPTNIYFKDIKELKIDIIKFIEEIDNQMQNIGTEYLK